MHVLSISVVGRLDFQKLRRCCLSETRASFNVNLIVLVYVIIMVFNKIFFFKYRGKVDALNIKSYTKDQFH